MEFTRLMFDEVPPLELGVLGRVVEFTRLMFDRLLPTSLKAER